MGLNEVAVYPRGLRLKERDLLDAVLPENRPGYRAYRDVISTMVVIGGGRRGEGNLVLGMPGDKPDLSLPLAPVFAFGVVETTRDVFSVTVREHRERQIDIEIVSSRGETIPDHFEERRRWTYSTWIPGTPSPDTGETAREVRINESLTLAMLVKERRLLLHDAGSGVNHLIPITTFYDELMMVKNIRDPKIALHSGLLFQDARSPNDDDLRSAFIAYNRVRRRVPLVVPPAAPRPVGGLPSLVRKLFGKGSE